MSNKNIEYNFEQNIEKTVLSAKRIGHENLKSAVRSVKILITYTKFSHFLSTKLDKLVNSCQLTFTEN